MKKPKLEHSEVKLNREEAVTAEMGHTVIDLGMLYSDEYQNGTVDCTIASYTRAILTAILGQESISSQRPREHHNARKMPKPAPRRHRGNTSRATHNPCYTEETPLQAMPKRSPIDGPGACHLTYIA